MRNLTRKLLFAVRNPRTAARKMRFRSEYEPGFHTIRTELMKSFGDFCRLESDKKKDIARKLMAQQGQIDAAIEGIEGKENQRDLTIKFHWGHNHRFDDDLHIAGRMGDRHINLVCEFMNGFDLPRDFFNGKSCIDVGSWTGGTTLMLKHLGATRVLALEEVQKYANTTLSLCRDVYELEDVASGGVNLYDLDVPGEKYDVAYFPGVVYHLSDPVLGLRKLFNSVVDGGVCLVESAGLDKEEPIARFDGNRIYHSTSGERADMLNRGGWNWYLPSPLCLERWMVEAGFNNVRTYYSYTSNRVFGYGERTGYVDICRAGFSEPDIE